MLQVFKPMKYLTTISNIFLPLNNLIHYKSFFILHHRMGIYNNEIQLKMSLAKLLFSNVAKICFKSSKRACLSNWSFLTE